MVVAGKFEQPLFIICMNKVARYEAYRNHHLTLFNKVM